MQFENQNEAQAYLEELKEKYPQLPVVFVFRKQQVFPDEIKLPPILSARVTRIKLNADEEGKVEIRSNEALRYRIRKEMDCEYGRRLYHDNLSKYMGIFKEKAERYKRQYKTAIVVAVAW